MMMKISTNTLLLPVLILTAIFALSCGGDDSDSDSDDGPDDDMNDDAANDDATDDDDVNDDADDDAFEGILPTTLDLTLIPTQSAEGWILGEGAPEPHISRNDLQAVATRSADEGPLSLAYFLVMTDQHQADEESPTRLDFFGSWEVFFGMFESFHRPQQDLTSQILNALVRTANGLQADYERDFDLALVLGDGADNAQFNEMKVLIDVLDGSGLSSVRDGWARPDSGDLNIDPATGHNLGERDFGIQEYDAWGNPNMLYFRPGYPNSNADFPVEGLLKTGGQALPWYYAIGNHDTLAGGGFNPDGKVTSFSRADYVGDIAYYGFIPGIASTVSWMKENGNKQLYIGNGFFGWDNNWQKLYLLMIWGEWRSEIDWRFDLDALVNDTPEDPSDDGVIITPDPKRAFMGPEGLIPLIHERGHGFDDNNDDGDVNAADGGWYRIDWPGENPDAPMPMRLLMLDTMDAAIVSEGGLSPAQLSWLKGELDQAVADKVLVIVGSHHHEEEIIVGGARFQALLHNCPNAILHLVGHDHKNKVVAHPDESANPLRGYWEVQTASTVEFPQQGRIVEVVDNRDGTGTIYATIFDHWPVKGDAADDLAGLGRDIALEEYAKLRLDDSRKFGGPGGPADRNVALIFDIPPDVADRLALMESSGAVTSTDVLGHRYEGE